MTTRRKMILIGLVALTGYLAGCEEIISNGKRRGNGPNAKKKRAPKATHLADTAVTGDETNDGRGATQAAMNWMKKSAELSQELLYSHKQITELQAEKKKLQLANTKLRSEVTNYKREIKDANAMLDSMKRDLKEWRASVLGFRKDSMATMNALLVSQKKILELLGAEIQQDAQASVAKSSAGTKTPK
ncbi:MAG: hypothetical protein K8S55_04145 [Phycisphaerae bacterium]|nr:hypothetical protein [Phycisphaerae bacterium]